MPHPAFIPLIPLSCPEGHHPSSALSAGQPDHSFSKPAHMPGISVSMRSKLRTQPLRYLDPGCRAGGVVGRPGGLWAGGVPRPEEHVPDLGPGQGGRKEEGRPGEPGAAAWQVPVPRVGKFLISPALTSPFDLL